MKPLGHVEREPLTPREQQVLQLLTEEHSVQAIADILHISFRTVKNHLSSIYSKMGVLSQTAAVLRAIRSRLVEFEFDDEKGS